MFGNVVVGVDEHEGGRDAIALAGALTSADAELTLVHVYADGAPEGLDAVADPGPHDRARALLSAARDEAGVDARLTCVASPSVGRGLHQTAELRGADLLVVGSTRRGLFGRVLLGDDTRDALNGAPCAVAVAPAGYRQQTHDALAEIGVGYDGSPESEHALEFARGLALEAGASLTAFEVVSLPAYLFAGGPVPADESIDEAVRVAREHVAALGDVQPRAAYGNPAEELALWSGSLDLLVVGSRDYGPVGRLVHGSTSQQLARSARSPLLVLTRATRSVDPVD